jgi:hypothetical protein
MMIVSSVTAPRQVVLSGRPARYGYGMTTGGPAIIVWGWPIAGIVTLSVGLAMAEVCSSFPMVGGLYHSLGRASACGSGVGHRGDDPAHRRSGRRRQRQVRHHRLARPGDIGHPRSAHAFRSVSALRSNHY